MKLKRGTIYVVLVVIFVLLSSVVFGEKKLEIVMWEGNCDEADECPELLNLTEGYYTLSDFVNSGDGGACDALDWEEIPGSFPMSAGRGSAGCYIEFVEDDSPNANDCAWVGIKTGNIIGSNSQRALPLSSATVVDEWEDASNIFSRTNDGKKLFTSPRELLCGNDEHWYECNDDSVNDEILQITDPNDPNRIVSYKCIGPTGPAENLYFWEDLAALQTDADDDGVPDIAGLDCDATRNDVHGSFSPSGCVNVPKGGNLQEGQIACVPPAVEMCGDGADNDCDGLIDNCGKSKDNCLAAGRSWIDSGTANQCCGDKPGEDVGKIVAGSIDNLNDNYICLTSDKIYTGYVGDSANDIIGWDNTRCTEDWCWVGAQAGANKIYSIGDVYDVVSNGNRWVECKGEEGEGVLGISENVIEPREANKFYCYQEGIRGVWAQCLTGGEQINNSIKTRIAGDGAFAFAVPSEPASSLLVDLNGYDDYYGQKIVDLTGNKNIEFMLKFAALNYLPASVVVTFYGQNNQLLFERSVLGYATNTPLLNEESGWIHIKLPLPQVTPLSGASRLYGIQSIKFESSSEQNEILIKNVYLSKGSSSPICSGTASSQSGKSSWLDDLDFVDLPRSGQQICNLLYDPGTDPANPAASGNAWLGDNVPGQNKCCGDDSSEYFVGDTSNSYGCWNSNLILPGQAITNVEFIVSFTEDETPLPAEMRSYPCASTECIYAVPGMPPYQITNSHPGLYELYFVSANGEMLITQPNQQFFAEGNIKASNVPLQVIHINQEDPSGNLDQGFYGCNAPDYLIGSLTQNLNYCAVKEGKFCAYGFTENDITAISSWTDEPLAEVTGVSAEGEQKGLQLIDFLQGGRLSSEPDRGTSSNPSFSPQERVQSSTVVPGKNILPNPEFSEAVRGNVIGWEIFNNNENSESLYISRNRDATGNGIILDPGVRLRSNRIPMQGNMPLYFSQEGACNNMMIYVVGKNGRVTVVTWPEIDETVVRQLLDFTFSDALSVRDLILLEENLQVPQYEMPSISAGLFSFAPALPEFRTPFDASYIVVEFVGPSGQIRPPWQIGPPRQITPNISTACRVLHPQLQLLDKPEPMQEFSLVQYPEKPRAAAACCPENYCWNGYSCVEPMGSYTSIAERVDGRDYRCIDGMWTAQAIKRDWNSKEAGYCSSESQCFVVSSAAQGADSKAVVADFYAGKYPTCINDGEYIFDNYCENGNWTSRTKVLVAQLLNSAEQSSSDYTLYCANIHDALPNIEGQEGILEGLSVSSAGLGSIGSIDPTTALKRTCYDRSDQTWKKLAPNNNCINNVCLLKYKSGGIFPQTKITFATTLNKDPADANSFLPVLGIAPANLKQLCPGNNFENVENCARQELEGDLYYNAQLNAIIYGKQGFNLRGGIVQASVNAVISVFRNLFGFSSPLSLQQDFIAQAENFNEVYFYKNNDQQQVRAVKEKLSGKEMLIAEYENFQTPICSYINLRKIGNQQLQDESRAALGGEVLICQTDGNIQRIESIAGLDYLWPELTGKLRHE